MSGTADRGPRARRIALLVALTAAVVLVAVSAMATLPPPTAREDGLGTASEVTFSVPTGAEATTHAGFSAAVRGRWAVLGAPYADVEGRAANGTASLWHWEPIGYWANVAALPENNPASYRYFGWGVAVSDDQLFVSSVTKSAGGGTVNGLVYVYEADDTPSIVQTLSASGSGNGFGRALAVDGDTLVVGASIAAVDTTMSGCAFVFEKVGGVWTQTQRIDPPDPETNQLFGDAIALDGDDLVIGSPQHSPSQAGRVYLYRRNATDPAHFDYFGDSFLTSPSANDQFGKSVAVRDGVMVAGAPGRDTSVGVDAGAAYVSRWRDDSIGTGWQQIADLESPSALADEQFGRNVALSDDDLLVQSMFGPGPTGAYSGKPVYHYVVDPEFPVEPAYVGLASDDALNGTDSYGQAMGFDGDTLVLGESQYQTVPGAFTGAARFLGGLRTARVRYDRVLSVGSPGLLGNDICGVAMSATLTANPAHGVATVAEDGAWTYDPTGWFIGTDTFRYSATSAGGSSETTVSVVVYPPATKVATSVSIHRGAKTVRRYHKVRLYGRLNPGAKGDKVVVYVRRPGSRSFTALSTRSAYSVTPGAGANWSYYAKLTRRGVYAFKVRYRGDAYRSSDWSGVTYVRAK